MKCGKKSYGWQRWMNQSLTSMPCLWKRFTTTLSSHIFIYTSYIKNISSITFPLDAYIYTYKLFISKKFLKEKKTLFSVDMCSWWPRFWFPSSCTHFYNCHTFSLTIYLGTRMYVHFLFFPNLFTWYLNKNLSKSFWT